MTDLPAITSRPRGRPEVAELEITIVRGLTDEDRPALTAPPVVGTGPPSIKSLRATHHALARALAEGRNAAEAGLLTGYSLGRISDLKQDPAFQELMVHYQTQREIVFADALARMNALGMATLEELQERLESSPEKFANRELMELAELLLVKGRTGAGAAAGPGPISGVGVAIRVSFAAPSGPPIIDAEVAQ